jgi:hypothetical protein
MAYRRLAAGSKEVFRKTLRKSPVDAPDASLSEVSLRRAEVRADSGSEPRIVTRSGALLRLLRMPERRTTGRFDAGGNMARWAFGTVIGGICLLFFGCLGTLASDPMGRKYSLENTQREYTEAIRWGQFDTAASFVSSDVREEFHTFSGAFEQIRITDYEVGRIILDEEKMNATVHVTYRGYHDGVFVEKPLREVHEWYRLDGNEWWVRPQMSSLIDPFRTQSNAGDVPASR